MTLGYNDDGSQFQKDGKKKYLVVECARTTQYERLWRWPTFLGLLDGDVARDLNVNNLPLCLNSNRPC